MGKVVKNLRAAADALAGSLRVADRSSGSLRQLMIGVVDAEMGRQVEDGGDWQVAPVVVDALLAAGVGLRVAGPSDEAAEPMLSANGYTVERRGDGLFLCCGSSDWISAHDLWRSEHPERVDALPLRVEDWLVHELMAAAKSVLHGVARTDEDDLLYDALKAVLSRAGRVVETPPTDQPVSADEVRGILAGRETPTTSDQHPVNAFAHWWLETPYAERREQFGTALNAAIKTADANLTDPLPIDTGLTEVAKAIVEHESGGGANDQKETTDG